MSRKLLAVLVVAVVPRGGQDAAAQRAAAERSAVDALPSGADFPPYDGQLWTLLHTGHVRKLAARRLAQGSYTPETVELLAKAGRLEDLLHATRVIVEKHPDRVASTFEVTSRDGYRIHSDRSRDFAGTLHGLIDEARKRLSGIPREEAARLERQLSP